jgi:hypothetical protein
MSPPELRSGYQRLERNGLFGPPIRCAVKPLQLHAWCVCAWLGRACGSRLVRITCSGDQANWTRLGVAPLPRRGHVGGGRMNTRRFPPSRTPQHRQPVVLYTARRRAGKCSTVGQPPMETQVRSHRQTPYTAPSSNTKRWRPLGLGWRFTRGRALVEPWRRQASSCKMWVRMWASSWYLSWTFPCVRLILVTVPEKYRPSSDQYTSIRSPMHTSAGSGAVSGAGGGTVVGGVSAGYVCATNHSTPPLPPPPTNTDLVPCTQHQRPPRQVDLREQRCTC